MLLAACLVSTLVGIVVGAELSKCCFDKQFTVNLGEFGSTVVSGHPLHFEGVQQLGFDFYRHRRGSINHIGGGFNTPVKTSYELKDYTARRVYTAEEDKNCTWTEMPSTDQMLPPCIPDDATYLGSGMLGYGMETFNVNWWKFMLPGVNTQVEFGMTNSCVPVIETVLVGSTDISLFWTNYHPGIENISHLEPPANCRHACELSNFICQHSHAHTCERQGVGV